MRQIAQIAVAGLALLTMINPDTQAQGASVKIEGPNCELNAVYYKPAQLEEGKKCPMIILCHGFGGNKEDALIRLLAAKLETRGIATLSFDFAGSGSSTSRRFEFKDMTLRTEMKDLQAVIDYAEDLPFVSSIGVAGHSMGGAVSLMTAADEGKRKVKALALMSPAVTIHADALRGFMLGSQFDPKDPPRTLSIGSLTIGRGLIESAQKTNMAKMAAEYKGKTLIVFGTADMVTLYTDGEYLDEIMNDSELKLYKDLDHGLSNTNDPQGQEKALNDIADFFVKALK
ncbi:MAG: alpha/beta hydrolase family protein [Marinilabiliaceae bacterium]|nr:alpha/beta fold hydrolase [Bacteroidales bacterium]MDD5816144.1 alpha/beta fold hydrolase [Bacteroidales bacterium]MDY4520780.1 alpha/beta fold hydrolase [Bacteroidales bacterium]